jgi:hypothetical protein
MQLVCRQWRYRRFGRADGELGSAGCQAGQRVRLVWDGAVHELGHVRLVWQHRRNMCMAFGRRGSTVSETHEAAVAVTKIL